jgi:hypothetical protein
MTEPRQIATVRDYAQLHAALRARAEELRLSRETIDAISGLQSGYSGKLLAPVPIKGLGPATLGPILGAMGVFIVLVEDVEMLERYAARQPKKSERFGRHTGQDVPANIRGRGWALLPLVTDSEFQRVMRCRQLATQGPAERKRIARKAARARWKRRRATKVR